MFFFQAILSQIFWPISSVFGTALAFTESLTTSFNGADKLAVDVVMMASVACRTVFLCQLDTVAFDPVDGADMSPIFTDDFHVFLDFSHMVLLVGA